MITRRQALAGIAALPLASCAGGLAGGPANRMASTPSLHALAQRSGRRFGTAIASIAGQTSGGTIQNADYASLVARECGVVVAENEMKWGALRPSPDKFDFARFDAIADWAEANGKALRGHTLLWHRPEWFPGWLNNHDFGSSPVQAAEKLLTDHIRTVTARYRGKISSYDVVNEAIDHSRNAPMETSLSRAMGSAEAVLDLAFHTAREAAPGVQLVYNDYMSWEPQHRQHCRDVLKLLEGFKARGTPVDALGIQSHIEMFSIDPATGVGPYMEREWRSFLDEVVAMGYDLVITEFDVKDKALPADIALRDAKVADYARRYFDLMLDYEQLGDILMWGMVDRFNWLQYFDFAKRADGFEVRGSPFDSSYKAKPMRDALAASLASAS